MRDIRRRLRDWVQRTSLTVWIVLAFFTGAPIYSHIRHLQLPDVDMFRSLRAEAKWMLPCQIALFGVVLAASIVRWRLLRKETEQAQPAAAG
jgi:hypothetical protein